MSTRTKIKVRGKTSYAVRDKKGRFKDIQNIGRAIRADSRRKAKSKPKKKGKGHTGDY